MRRVERTHTKVGILSLGCPRNLVDSESLLGKLDLKGYEIVDVIDCDVAIVNTCAFIEDAKRESIDAILELVLLKKEGKIKKIIVAGCLSQRYRDQLAKELPEVDSFVGTVKLVEDEPRYALTPKHFAYLKICESCVNSCSFCVIPNLKGAFSSLNAEAVVKKARAFDKEKISELNIIGQDITGYGLDLDGKRSFSDLLRKIMRSTEHIGWIRLLYLYPDKSVEEVLDIMRDEPRLCRYVDLPIQHCNDRVLKAMNRRTTKNDIVNLLVSARRKVPDVSIRTSVIVGFPSETDKEFRELLDFIGEMKFDRLGAFVYSREEGTRAFDMSRQIPEKIKKERFDAVMQLQQKVSLELNERFLGVVRMVLIDELDTSARGAYVGRTQADAPEVDGLVYVKSAKKLRVGDFVQVTITDTMEYDLVGEVLT